MRNLFLVVIMAVFTFGAVSAADAAGLINGAGATFPYPLYSKWSYEYNKKTGVRLNYQSIGSGGGIQQIKSKTVDFGASDMPMQEAELASAGLMQFPMAIGGVVPVINVKGVKSGELRLTPELLTDIYMGVITKWSDKRLAGLNPGLKLPDDSITVVHRSDGSGTTWIFVNYLDKVSKSWHDKVGVGTAVNWPVGVGGKGNEGVATYVKRMKNSIGYVEYVYAVQNKLTSVSLQNKAGEFVSPSIESFGAAAKGADWNGTKGFGVILTDQPGKAAWPISGATFILVQTQPANCANAEAALTFFDWAYTSGAQMARGLDYIP
ncbi:MAG: phosphate ABC transporter substrate-binding protein PstS, partial [Deltaproteobacteria bacterium RIFCSPLOWO2_02_FULL_53_8]